MGQLGTHTEFLNDEFHFDFDVLLGLNISVEILLSFYTIASAQTSWRRND